MDIKRAAMPSSDEIYQDLCNKIEKLEYMPGEKLSENDICSVYGATRHVVRNALATLRQRKLVEVYPQRGTFVSLIDMEYIQDILYIRESVEQEALARIMDMEDNSALILKMQKAVDGQKNLNKDRNYSDAFYALDNVFHLAMLDAVNRPNVLSIIADPYIHIRRWRNFEIRSEARMQEIIEEHQAIIEAIKNKDRMGGRAFLNTHLDTVNRYSKELKETEAQYFI